MDNVPVLHKNRVSLLLLLLSVPLLGSIHPIAVPPSSRLASEISRNMWRLDSVARMFLGRFVCSRPVLFRSPDGSPRLPIQAMPEHSSTEHIEI